jgi:hypothetical protein
MPDPEIPVALLDRLCQRGWAITRLEQDDTGRWFGTAEYLPGGPSDPVPDTFFVERGSPTRDACLAKLRELVAQEIARGKWTDVAERQPTAQDALRAAWTRADAAYEAYRVCATYPFGHWQLWQAAVKEAERLGPHPDAGRRLA